MATNVAGTCRSSNIIASGRGAGDDDESYEKARYYNLLNLRKKKKEASGVWNKRTIQMALGKCQPRQRMWGVSGTVILGGKLEVLGEQLAMLDFLSKLQTAETIVKPIGGRKRAVGLVRRTTSSGRLHCPLELCSLPWRRREYNPIRPLLLPDQYIAISPDGMLSVQEGFMASEGMDTWRR